MSQQELFSNIDSRWPSAVSIAACSAFGFGRQLHYGTNLAAHRRDLCHRHLVLEK